MKKDGKNLHLKKAVWTADPDIFQRRLAKALWESFQNESGLVIQRLVRKEDCTVQIDPGDRMVHLVWKGKPIKSMDYQQVSMSIELPFPEYTVVRK